MKTKKEERSVEVSVKFKTMVGFGGGLRTEWVTGSGRGIEFGLDSGAGTGNPLMTFWVKKKCVREYYTADVREMIEALVSKLGDR